MQVFVVIMENAAISILIIRPIPLSSAGLLSVCEMKRGGNNEAWCLMKYIA